MNKIHAKPVLVIGLGNMGSSIAARLVSQGYSVLGYDLDPVAARKALGDGVQLVDDLIQGLEEVEFVLTSLPTPLAVEELFLGPQGVVASLSKPMAVIELSTIDPETMRRVASALESRSYPMQVVDAPVSGGIEDMRAGTASLLVGGTPDAVGHCQPLLDALGSVKICGEVGEAKMMKLLNNLVSIANVLVGVEALRLADAVGINRERFATVLSSSGAQSYQFNKRIPRAISGDFHPRFSLALAKKDLDLVMSVADVCGIGLPVSTLVAEQFEAGVATDLGELDMVGIYRLYNADNHPKS